MANVPNITRATGNETLTTISIDIDTVVTSITVADGSGFSEGYIIIDEGESAEEVCYVESVVGNTLTIATNGRGLEGTSAANHAAGAVVHDIIVAKMFNGMIDSFLQQHNDDGTHKASNDYGIVGEIKIWSTNTAPTNWLICDGAAVSRTTYASLFAVISTTYGVGDGSTTFNLPNMKGKVVVGRDSADTDFDNLNDTGGAKTHTLTTAELAVHTHIQNAHNHTLRMQVSDNPGSSFAENAGYSNQAALGSAPANVIGNTTATNQNAGSGDAHNNLQPFITLNYIIRA